MDLSKVYEIQVPRGKPFGPLIAEVSQKPGGLELLTENGIRFLDFEDIDEQLIDDEAQGVIEIHYPDRRVVLQKITLATWADVDPFLGRKFPLVTSDEALTQELREWLEDSP